MNSFKVVDKKPIYQGSFFSVSQDVFTQTDDPQGLRITRDIVHHPGAVVILAFAADKSIYFVKQFRHAIDCEIIELPAGCLELGEEPLSCAQRELQEEIGFAANEWNSLGTIYPAPGFCDEVQYIFLAHELRVSKLPGDEDEQIEVVQYTFEQVKQLIVDNKIQDAKTLAVLSMAQLRGLI